MQVLALDKITKIESFPKERNAIYYVSTRKKKVGFFKYEKEKVIRSFYDLHGKFCINLESFKDDHSYYDEEKNAVFFNPYCNVYLTGGCLTQIFFDTEEELNKYVLELSEKINGHVLQELEPWKKQYLKRMNYQMTEKEIWKFEMEKFQKEINEKLK